MKWPVGDRIGELFADAYAAVGELREAIKWYDAVLESEAGNISVRAFEQRSNLRIRLAWEAVAEAESQAQATTAAGQRTNRTRRAAATRNGAGSPALRRAIDTARRVIDTESRRLSKLQIFGETAERYNLLGSAKKRLAMVEDAARKPRAERAAVVEMRKHYQDALEQARKAGSAEAFYPAMNLIVAQLALGEKVDDALFAVAHAGHRAKEAEGATFWSVVGATELLLLDAIANRRLQQQKRKIITGYNDLAKRMRSGLQWRSVYDTARFALLSYRQQTSGTRMTPEAKAGAEILELLKKQVAPPG
jgi:hypothetical protein